MSYERANIAAMTGYSYGEQPGSSDVIKLNTNENPHPPSPAVQAALDAIDVSSLRVYPSAMGHSLREAVARHHGVAPEQVVLTHGGDEALRLAMTTFVGPGDGFGMAEPSYSLYPVLAQVQDARILRVPLDAAWRLPDDAASQLNRHGARLTCLVNPHAPSGVLQPAEPLGTLARALDGVLLLDEAYADFIAPEQGYDAVALLKRCDNLLILRTFSKGYSLAGLRLGYLLGNEALIDPIASKTRDSYNIDGLSQALGTASIGDQAYAQQVWARVRQDRDALRAGLGQLGFTIDPSQTNFLLAQVPGGQAATARQLFDRLRDLQIFVRYFDDERLANKLRISVGTADQNQRLIAALQQLLGESAV
jgi:histidinol-phosphate aminotransferase